MKAELEEFEHMHFLVYTVKNIPKSFIWSMLLTAFCSLRAANTFTIVCAYIILISRMIQVIGLIIANKLVSDVSYAIIVLFMVMMFFADFASESADIVHESMPMVDG